MERERPTTVIAPGTRILGGLVAEGDLVIAGVVEGPVVGGATVRLERGAAVRGEIRGRDVIVAGALNAPLTATASVRLEQTAEVYGDIEAPRVVIDDGALLEGAVRMVKARTRVDLPALSGPPPATPPIAAPPEPPQLATRQPPPPSQPPKQQPPPHRRREIPELPALGRRALVRRTP